MRTIVFVTPRQPIAQLLTQRLRDVPGANLIYEPDYAGFVDAISSYGADTALVEVEESGQYDMAYCLSLCKRIRKEAPNCRVLLLCPEQDAAGVSAAVEAMRDGRIDDFLFCNTTTEYLTAKLLWQ